MSSDAESSCRRERTKLLMMKLTGNLVAQAPNVPFGLSFMGPLFGEEALIGYAYAYEQRTRHRDDVQPYIMPRTEIWDVLD